MAELASRIAENLKRVHERMAAAATASGRKTSDVTLVAVTKYVSLPAIRALLACGYHELGESRPQELWQKAEALDMHEIHWHLVGHLQRNKVRRTLPIVRLIHSVDSLRLIATIDREARQQHLKIPILLEVNTSQDAAKHGMTVAEVREIVPDLGSYEHVQVRGLMCMAAAGGGLDAAQRNFAELRELRDSLRAVCASCVSLDELSMGMSHDLEVAIREGATMVRVGSALFEGLPAGV
jgi:pyridoxal phosphate enzyme (YggS family)